MPSRGVGVPDTAPATAVVEVDAVERSSPDLTTTTTADPGTGGTTLAVTSAARFPATTPFKIDVVGTSGIAERMVVTAGAGTTSWTVTRAQDFTAAVAHSVGAIVSLVTAVQRVEPVDASKQVSFKGRTATFRTPGRAGTTGRKLFALHNATGSPVNVDISKITLDHVQTAAKAVTVLPPVVKAVRFTAVPTGGTTLTKNPEDSGLTSKVAVTAWGDASADGTSSATPLAIPAVTVGSQVGVLSQAFAPRLITAAGFEMVDANTFFDGEDETITLRALEGVCIFLDYTLATQEPTTDSYIVSARWTEWRPA